MSNVAGTNNWIARSERDFTDDEFPLFLAKQDTQQVMIYMSAGEMKRVEPMWCLFTHWQSARKYFPPPPPRKKTQREIDEQMLYEEYDRESQCGDTTKLGWFVKGGLYGIMRERATILEIIDKIASGSPEHNPYPEISIATRIEKRCRE